MHLNPYGEDPVRLAVSLANDRPATVSDLRDRCCDAGLVIPASVTSTDLGESLALLDEWVAVVDAPDDHTRVERLNALMAAHTSHPRMTDHAGTGWHIHFRDDHCSLAKVLAVIVSVGTAFHLTARGMHRLGRCHAPDCHTVYADFSRTGTQRYCSVRCANRDAVSRHRARRRASA